MRIQEEMNIENIQLEFYKDNKINPVSIKTTGEQWQSHLWQRGNLYENHLKIPSTWFNKKSVLEFGPNGGENAIVHALNGANVTLIEPHLLMHDRIYNLFSTFNLTGSLSEIYTDTVEDFTSKNKYDLVIAEGFLHALTDRDEVVKKLCSYSNDRVIFTYSDRYGYFFEAFKRFVYRRVLDIEGVNDEDFGTQLLYAKKLFFTEFSLLKSSRSFDSWVRDVLLNPCQTSETLDILPDLIKGINDTGFSYASGSPSFDMRDKYSWYKKTIAGSIDDQYWENVSFFINGNNDTCFLDKDLDLIHQYCDFFLDYSAKKIKFNSLENFQSIASISNWCHSMDVNLIIESMHKGDSKFIINQFCTSKVSEVWGMPHHYVCLSKGTHVNI